MSTRKEILDKQNLIKENQHKIYEKGRQDYWSDFWDAYYGNRTWGYPSGIYLFGGAGWNDDNFYPKSKDVMCAGSMQSVFAYNQCTNLKQRLEECGVRLVGTEGTGITTLNTCFLGCETSELPSNDFFVNVRQSTSKALDISRFAESCKKITSVPYYYFFANATNYNGAFNQCTQLETVEGIDFSSSTNNSNVFKSCSKLKNITVYGTINVTISFSDSPLLTHDSLMNVIDALKDYSGTTTTQVLDLHDDSIAILTESEKKIAEQKGWTIA